jgi:hypothetical protein
MKHSRRAERLALLCAERERLQSHLRDRFPAEHQWQQRARELRRVAIVVGSPRGGTSIIHHVLRSAEDAVAPLGEHRCLFTLRGWNFPDATLDRECVEDMPIAPPVRQALLDQIALECWGEPNLEPTAEQRSLFAWNWALRFQLQWPDLGVDSEWLAELVEGVTATLQRRGTTLSGQNVTAAALRALLDAGVPLDPHLYSLDDRLHREVFTDVPESRQFPGETILEIPPFIAFGPRHRPRVAARSTLVIKASSDAYRLPTLRNLFAGWRIHWLHLARNPLAAVNGLLDGWAHRGFWQHDLTALGKQQVGRARAAAHLWCFDVFPGWREYLNRPLSDVCLEQWHYPHSRILTHLGSEPDVTRARFEDFLANGRIRRDLLVRLADGLGLTCSSYYLTGARNPEIINATVAPAPARWLRTRPGLISLLTDDRVATMAVRLGYTPKEVFEWN